MTKNFIIFIGITTKAIKFSIADENLFVNYPNLFVCILSYFSKNINFQWIIKKCKNNKI